MSKSTSGWHAAALTLIAATFAINLTALALPLIGRQIINHGHSDPTGLAIPLLVGLVVTMALIEAMLRFFRSMIVIDNDRQFMTGALHWLISQVVSNPAFAFGSAAATSIDLTRAMEQIKQDVNGETVIAKAEIAFIPILALAIFATNWLCGIFVVLYMAGFAVFTLRGTGRYVALAESTRNHVEQRFQMLFAILEKMEIVKSHAVEQRMARLYQSVNSEAMRHDLALCVSGIHLNQLSTMASMLMTSMLLLLCAIVGAGSHINLVTVVTVVLLASKLMEPIQRAIFLYTQSRDRANANAKIATVMAERSDTEKTAPPPPFETLTDCRLRAFNPRLADVPSGAQPISLTIRPGEIIAITADQPSHAHALLRAMAGLDEPANGQMLVNGHDIRGYSPDDRNAIFAYLSPDARLFDGTILGNVTRLGTVPVKDVYEVAELMGIDRRLNALPKGLQTPVGGLTGGSIPPGLVRQIVLLRGLSHRPRIIMFDHADTALDRDGYASLLAFFERIRGFATIVLATDDANLRSLADRTFAYTDGNLAPVSGTEQPALVAYRSLVL